MKKIFFFKKKELKNYLKKVLTKKKQNYYFFELKLRGVGFKSYFLSNKKILFILGYSHFIIYKILKNDLVLIKKGKLILISKTKENLGMLITDLKNLRIIDPYKAKGVIESNIIPNLKKGKVRT